MQQVTAINGVNVIKAGIVGGTGYTGAELLRVLTMHPEVAIAAITSRAEAGRRVDTLFPNLRGVCDLEFSAPDSKTLLDCDVIFFATPHGIAQSMMKASMTGGARIIDLSADFRIKDIALWEHWYGQKHACPELVSEAVYGLPEFNRGAIQGAQLIACPGCYPTSVQLALMPLLKSGWIDPEDIIVNSASGMSGAGRNAKTGLLLAENYDNFKAYSVAGHRHQPEIEQGLSAMQCEGEPRASITFVPHLLPTIRGIHSTIYAKLNHGAEDLQALYESCYANEVFVDVLPKGSYPETRSVKGTNVCRISVENPLERGRLVLMSVIDNLAKGASLQAVQNMNIAFGFHESTGLDQLALFP